MDLVLANSEVNLPILPNDMATLVNLWSRSRTEYLNWILTRKGVSSEQVRVNTRNTYAVALNQFFGGIYPKLHEAHEADMAARGEYVEPVWPEVVPWLVSATTARQFKDILALKGKSVMGKVTLSSGKVVRSEVGRAGLAEASVNIKLAGLKTYFDFLVSLFEIPYRPQYRAMVEAGVLHLTESSHKVLLWRANWRNPFDPKAVTPYSVDQRPTWLDSAEVRAILSEIDPTTPLGARDIAIIMTLWSTACRASEVINLRWKDLHPKTNGNVLFRFRGKSGKQEEVELQRDVYALILRYLSMTGRLNDLAPDSPVFTAVYPGEALKIDSVREMYPDGIPDERPLSYKTALKAFQKYAARAGIDDRKAHFHALRHGRARQTVSAMKDRHGMTDIVTVNKLLRHSSLDMTRHYTDHFEEAEDPWATDAIAAVMPGQPTRG